MNSSTLIERGIEWFHWTNLTEGFVQNRIFVLSNIDRNANIFSYKTWLMVFFCVLSQAMSMVHWVWIEIVLHTLPVFQPDPIFIHYPLCGIPSEIWLVQKPPPPQTKQTNTSSMIVFIWLMTKYSKMIKVQDHHNNHNIIHIFFCFFSFLFEFFCFSFFLIEFLV